jgi:transposase InsO family protein
MTEADVAAAAGVDRKTVRKWTRRKHDEGDEGLKDRSSRPHSSPTALPSEWKEAVEALRRLRFTQSRIAKALGLSKSRVQRVVADIGLAKLRDLEPPLPENRYQKERAGELVHVDTKKLARFFQPGHRVTGSRKDRRMTGHRGYEVLHIAIDDRTRLAYAELLPDELGVTCAGFLLRAAAFFSRHGIRRIERVMSDNGSGYRSQDFRTAVEQLRAKHKRTKPYTPRTNGKAERFIQTMLRSWAYGRPYNSSNERATALSPWLRWYNTQRGHGSLENRSPMETIKLLRRDNVLGHHN